MRYFAKLDLGLLSSVLTVIFLLYSSNLSFAEETKLDDEYVALLTASKFSEAFKYVSKGTDRESRLVTGYHLMLGSGIPKNSCAAVLIFEEMVGNSQFDRAKSALNIIYGGSWAAVASQEGSAKAFLARGLYYWGFPPEFRLRTIDPNKFFDEIAYESFFMARTLGAKVSESYFKDLDLSEAKKNAIENNASRTFMKVICPVREP